MCTGCRRSPPAFAVARSVFAYDGVLRAAIGALKYRRRRAVAEPLGRLLAALAPLIVLGDVEAVVPVPLHPARLRARGYNQAELLARPVAAALDVPCLTGALRRVRQEAAQVNLGAESRWANVADAFAPGPLPVCETLLLVDDVFSTGATAAACARALREAGASRVLVLTVGRTVLGSPVGRAEGAHADRRTPHAGPQGADGMDGSRAGAPAVAIDGHPALQGR